jgi:hypothetical protein
MAATATGIDAIVTSQLSLIASADLSSYIYYIVDIDTDGRVAVNDGTDMPTGVLWSKPTAAAQPCTVATGGLLKINAGGTCTAGSLAEVDSNGEVQDNSGAGWIVGRFVTSASAATQTVMVAWQVYYKAS